MLKLHQLEISGFKSFVDETKVRFAGGITAIVGPNGCGKSNISDAITWVLGEQSAKSLRGGSMQDVIFNGTDTRKPIGMAEVNLTLVTDPSMEHAVDGKILIGRRVFRTGESQYRLNGKVTRLKQIKELLMDTGLGIRAYSVIEQGKIGMILSGKPQERRRLLEEAAGITRYKARKRLAEIKLEEATANLLRLDDIVSEVERSLRSLKRQASAARRYKEKETEYRDLLRQVLLGRWALLRERMGNVESELAVLVDRDAELTATLHRDEATLAEGREEIDELAKVLAERHQRQADLAATIEGRQEFLKGARERRSEVEERLVRGREEAEVRARRSEELAGSLGSLDERAETLVAERAEAARIVAEDDASIAAAQKAVAEAEARLEGLRRDLLERIASVNQLRSQLQHEQVEIEKRTLRARYLDDERIRLDRQVGESESTLTAIDETVSTSGRRLEELAAGRDENNGILDTLLRREAEISDERRELETELSGLRQRQRILRELSEEHAEKREALVRKLAELDVAEPQFLADVVDPVEGFEDVIDQFLGELAEAVLVEPHRSALELARALSRLDTAGAFIKPAAGAPAVEVADPAIRHDLTEALRLPPELAGALPPAYLVDDAEDAARLAAAHPGVAFLSRDRVVAEAGTLRVRAQETTPGVLARESELEAIDAEIPDAEERLQKLGEALAGLVDERKERATTINRLEEQISGLEREIAIAKARRQDAAGRKERVASEQQTVAEEQEEIAEELVGRQEQKVFVERRLGEAEAEHKALEERFDQTQAEVEAAKSHRESLREAGAGRRGRLELLEERMDSQQQETVRVRRQIEEMGEQLDAWKDESEVLERRKVELEASMGTAETELQAALEARSEAQEAVLEQQQILDDRRDALRELEGQVQQTRGEREVLRSQIEEQRIGQASLRQDAEHLNATYRDEFKRLLPGTRPKDPEVAEALEAMTEEMVEDTDEETPERRTESDGDDAAGDENADGDEDGVENDENAASMGVEIPLEEDVELPDMDRARLAELEADLSRIKTILDRLGPVNVLAAEEYDEQIERENFLKTQRRDVAESVKNLKATIQEINEASTERFKATFEQVNTTFGKTFQKLFRGGEAEMRLLDEEDILETGIEIVARPPGKRPQNIMLLSGGEKALTAIALLFALFESRPSPFCILDEVDAPLDDANVMRFVDVLKEMAQDTQFLVVTHNKLTMEASSTLYGVTMEERGCSKLVSVELEDVQPQGDDVTIETPEEAQKEVA